MKISLWFPAFAAVTLLGLVACAPPTSTTNNSNTSGNNTSSVLGTATVTLKFNRVTVAGASTPASHYGVYLWVEKGDGTFVKTLSWYDDWGVSSSDGSNGSTKGFYVGTTASDYSGHLAQSATWRAKASVTSNSKAIVEADATTSATIDVSAATTKQVVFDGSTNTQPKAGANPDEYWGSTFTHQFQGWDGKLQDGTAAPAGIYRLRLTVSRKNNGIASPLTPDYTEYATANFAVGATASSATFSPGSVTSGVFTASNSGTETSGTPVLDTTSAVNFTPK